MAQLLKTPYKLPPIDYGNWSLNWQNDPHEVAFRALLDKSDNLPEGEVVGAVLRWPRADGYAFYLVTKEVPLTLQWVPYNDGWSVEPSLIRGLRLADVYQMVERERRLNALHHR